MSEPVASPPRLSSLPENEDPFHVGRMFRGARALPHEELPRLRWRLRTSQRLRAMRPRMLLRLALTVGLVFCMGGVVGAVVAPFWGRKEPVVASPTPATAPTPSKHHRKQRSAVAAPPAPVPGEPIADETAPVCEEAAAVAEDPAAGVPALALPVPAAEAPAPAAEVLAHAEQKPAEQKPAPARNRAATHVAMASPTAPRPAPTAMAPSPIVQEQTLLSQIMKTLRDGRDAGAALGLLAQHAQRFPEGSLTSEATMLRIEALLDLGRRDEALSALDRVPLASLPNRDEQLVVRGELRAAHGRWSEAKQDFDESLRARALPAAHAKVRSLQERALWGRAAARSRLGDQDGTRSDLALYLRFFPSGRFAGPAAALLEATP